MGVLMMASTYFIKVPDDFLAQIVSGNKMIMRHKMNEGDDWTRTIRIPLAGSSVAINNLISACSRGAQEDVNEWATPESDEWEI